MLFYLLCSSIRYGKMEEVRVLSNESIQDQYLDYKVISQNLLSYNVVVTREKLDHCGMSESRTINIYRTNQPTCRVLITLCVLTLVD